MAKSFGILLCASVALFVVGVAVGQSTSKVWNPNERTLQIESGGVINVKTGGLVVANGTPASMVPTANAAVTVPSTITPATLSAQLNELAASVNALITNQRGAGVGAPTPAP